MRKSKRIRSSAAGTLLALGLGVCPALAQIPKTGDINVYGLHKLTAEKILSTVNLKPGDTLPPSKGDLEDRIEEMRDVLQARVEAVCCDGASATLFIGIEEKGAPHTAFRSEPAGSATLPDSLADAYREFLKAVRRAAGRGHATEDFTAGHSIMDDPTARAYQPRFLTYADDHTAELREVLRNSSEPEQRAIAAAVIGYAPKKQAVLNDLQYALDDSDEAVRSNAMRSLQAIAVLAYKQPQLGLKIAPTWFVELLHSVALSDRVEAVRSLVILTDHGGQAALDQLRERALPDLAEMARWKTLAYALPPFLLLGRLTGLPDEETQQRWEKNDREPLIQKALSLGLPPKRSGK